MADETLKWIFGAAVTVIGAITGHSYKKLDDLRDSLPRDYRSKADCKEICDAFRKSIDRQTDKMDVGFAKIYDKLDSKEDKHQ